MTKRTQNMDTLVTKLLIREFLTVVESGTQPSSEQLQYASRILQEYHDEIETWPLSSKHAAKNRRINIFARIHQLLTYDSYSREAAIEQACSEYRESAERFEEHFRRHRYQDEMALAQKVHETLRVLAKFSDRQFGGEEQQD